jgi:glucose-6-phosphate 1-dehydrogenase
VQIDVPETLSVEGRAAFYDATGAYRDMIVTHLFQVMGFVAMEPPASLATGPLRDEQVKVFGALKPLEVRHVVRGQYAGYRSEPGVAAGSDTETLAVVRAEVENWRWQGVPFFLRSGKAMGASRQVITLGFHRPPLRMFRAHSCAMRASCADDTNHCTDGTHRAGLSSAPVHEPVHGHNARSLCPATVRNIANSARTNSARGAPHL